MTIGTDYFQSPRMAQMREKIASAKTEQDKKRFLATLTREIVTKLNDVTIGSIKEGIKVNNLDELKASLHNEINRVNQQLVGILKGFKLSSDEQVKVLKDIETSTLKYFSDEFQPIIIRRPHDKVEVTNFDAMQLPEALSITNLQELEAYFKSLEEVIKESLNINISAPQVNVNPAEINIPALNIPEINIPELDLSPVVKSVNDSFKKLIKSLNQALVVDKLDEVIEASKNVMLGFPGSIRIIGASGSTVDFGSVGIAAPSAVGDGNKSVTTAGTRVQLSSTGVPCKYVIVTANTANTDTIWLGSVTVAAGRGRPLVALQSEKIDIDNLNKVYIDSVVNGEGVSFVYVN